MSKTSNNANNNKQKTSTKITAEQTIIIIRLIKKYKCIWDRNHPDFRKRQIRYNAFKKIGSYFQLDAEDVSRKYRRFRNCYIQELKLIRDKKKSFSNLFYFDEMEFLRDNVEHRHSLSSSTSPPDEMHLDNNFDTEDDELPIESLDDEYSLEPIENFQFSSIDSNHSHSTEEPVIEVADIKEEIPFNIESEMVEECQVEEIDSEEELKAPTSEKTDEFDVFGGYLASQLREMDKISALETMEELQRVIFKRRIQILRRDQNSS